MRKLSKNPILNIIYQTKTGWLIFQYFKLIVFSPIILVVILLISTSIFCEKLSEWIEKFAEIISRTSIDLPSEINKNFKNYDWAIKEIDKINRK